MVNWYPLGCTKTESTERPCDLHMGPIMMIGIIHVIEFIEKIYLERNHLDRNFVSVLNQDIQWFRTINQMNMDH